MLRRGDRHEPRVFLALILIWGLAAGVDGLWLVLDRSVASWDPADHLIGSLNYWWTLQNAQWLSGEWWTGLWTLSAKYPPLLYISTAPLISLFGRGPDQSVLVNLFFTIVLLTSVYGIGKHLFNTQVGLWAAGLCLLYPQFYTVRIQYFMDYPLVALVAASFCCLTVWRDAKTLLRQWFWGLGCGFCLGLALLMKQSALFFFVVPLLWVAAVAFSQRAWGRLAQLFISVGLALVLILPWLSTNWLFQISAGLNSNVKSAIAEGDPPLNTLAAWTYYWNQLPRMVSLPLLIVPLVGLLMSWSRKLGVWRSDHSPAEPSRRNRAACLWLLVFLLGSYSLWSAVLNKDTRYIMPSLPILSVVLGYGLTQWRDRWQAVRWGTIGVAVVLTLLNLFPLGGALGDAVTQTFSPQAKQHPYLGESFPHPDVIDEIIRAQPYQLVNLGLLNSTATVNPHNFTYYGNRRNFQVYARRLGNTDEHLEQDVRSLSWFLVQTKREPSESSKTRKQRAKVLQLIRQSGDFQRHKSWTLPNGGRLNLFHRRIAPVEVQPLTGIAEPYSGSVQLSQVTLPNQAPPGVPLPVTYEWTGPWKQLHSGLVLLTWRRQNSNLSTTQSVWIHDHGIGLGTLHPGPIQSNQVVWAKESIAGDRPFRVIERTAMLPPQELLPGPYTLVATYLNRDTGERYPIPVPPIHLTINPSALPIPAPELDWVTQLRTLAPALSQGPSALDGVFDRVSRLNLYDPIQNYAVQAEQAFMYRLEQEPENLEYAYGLALARVLQRRVEGAIAALERVVQLDKQNPYAYTYLAFVNLYGFRPGAAQSALDIARTLQPNSREIQALSAIAAFMRGNLGKAWHDGQAALNS